jgi:hypothetical protein
VALIEDAEVDKRGGERSDLLSLCARILAARRLLHRKEVWRDIP